MPVMPVMPLSTSRRNILQVSCKELELCSLLSLLVVYLPESMSNRRVCLHEVQVQVMLLLLLKDINSSSPSTRKAEAENIWPSSRLTILDNSWLDLFSLSQAWLSRDIPGVLSASRPWYHGHLHMKGKRCNPSPLSFWNALWHCYHGEPRTTVFNGVRIPDRWPLVIYPIGTEEPILLHLQRATQTQ